MLSNLFTSDDTVSRLWNGLCEIVAVLPLGGMVTSLLGLLFNPSQKVLSLDYLGQHSSLVVEYLCPVLPFFFFFFFFCLFFHILSFQSHHIYSLVQSLSDGDLKMSMQTTTPNTRLLTKVVSERSSGSTREDVTSDVHVTPQT